MSKRTLLLLTAFLFACGVSQASRVMVDTSCTGTPPVGLLFTFNVNPPDTAGVSCQSFNPTLGTPFLTLDLFTSPLSQDLGTTCTSTFFFACTVSTTPNGLLDIHFVTGENRPGIPPKTEFSISLTGFPTGQQVTVEANVPEPGTASLAGLVMIATMGVNAWRRAKRVSGRGIPVSSATA